MGGSGDSSWKSQREVPSPVLMYFLVRRYYDFVWSTLSVPSFPDLLSPSAGAFAQPLHSMRRACSF